VLFSLITPHLLVWGIIGFLIIEIALRWTSITINIVALCIGIPIFIFAHKISPWWNKHIGTQAQYLSEHLMINIKTVKIILYGLGTRFTGIKAFRIYSFIIAALAFYHIYSGYSADLNNEITTGIMINIAMAFVLVWGWMEAKGAPYRFIVLKLGICWYIGVISSVIAMYFNLTGLIIITFMAFFAFIIYYIKWVRAKRAYQREHP
jgi:hypothetical protein